MDKMVINKDSQAFGGGVNTSSRASFGLKTQAIIASISEAIQKIFTKTNHKTQCHSELVSESHVVKIPHQVRDDKRGIPLLCKALAFTLAETLIVMGIIGVVAALTIPNLNSSTADKEKVAKVKKIYQNLGDAFGRAQAVYGPYDEWKQLDSTSVAQTTRFGERMTEFMKVSKNCKMEVNKGCLSSAKVKFMGPVEDKNYDAENSVYKFITADGTSVYFLDGGAAVVDIDGPTKGPTQYGKDIFMFQLRDNDFVPYRNAFSGYLADLSVGYGITASGWVIDYENMDYLKLTKDKKCPNGTTPTEQNPRCK